MKQLAILLPETASTLGSLILTIEVFEKANAFVEEPVFNIQLVGNGVLKHGHFAVTADRGFDALDDFDLVIIPALGDNVTLALEQNKNMLDWIVAQYKMGAEIATLCTGAFMLAAAGLLKGKQCSTHWTAAEEFERLFPDVDLEIDKIITDQQGLYTTGGALSSMNLVLHLVEKYYSRAAAIYCAKVFEIDLDRSSQSAFIIFSGQKKHEDDQIRKAQLYMEKNIDGKIMIDELSSRFSIDRRSFDRRFKKATGNSPIEYMQRIRTEAAKKLFETTRKTINEVMYEVGYTDLRSFREVFKKNTGLSPVEYKGKYNKDVLHL